MIKELKASSSLAALRLYTETAYSIIITLSVLKAHILACVSCEITIKSDNKIIKQHLWTEQDIIHNMSKVINFLNMILVTHHFLSRDITLFFNSEQSHFIWENC